MHRHNARKRNWVFFLSFLFGFVSGKCEFVWRDKVDLECEGEISSSFYQIFDLRRICIKIFFAFQVQLENSSKAFKVALLWKSFWMTKKVFSFIQSFWVWKSFFNFNLKAFYFELKSLNFWNWVKAFSLIEIWKNILQAFLSENKVFPRTQKAFTWKACKGQKKNC